MLKLRERSSLSSSKTSREDVASMKQLKLGRNPSREELQGDHEVSLLLVMLCFFPHLTVQSSNGFAREEASVNSRLKGKNGGLQ